MDFRLTEEQEMFRQAVADFVDKEVIPVAAVAVHYYGRKNIPVSIRPNKSHPKNRPGSICDSEILVY